jgi:3-oxoadipate enol-lactonase
MNKTTGVQQKTVAIGAAELIFERREAIGAPRHEPLVMLHPWYGCLRFWDRTVAALPYYETYALDLYSLGARPGWESFASPAGVSRAVEAFADAEGLASFSLMGNSMGGIAAQELASRLGPRVSKLILVGTGARIVGVQPAWRSAMDEWMAGPPNRAFTARMVSALIARPPDDALEFEIFVDAVMSANKAFMGGVLNAAFDFDLRPVLSKITAPTLVIRGELDAARTPAHVAELVAGIPNCRAIEIAGAGHSPQVDSAEAFCPLVRDFLAS